MMDCEKFEDSAPAKVYVCHCEQCKHVKNKRKNRKNKKLVRRALNKKRRKLTGVAINQMWA
jgi:hypothetical protein